VIRRSRIVAARAPLAPAVALVGLVGLVGLVMAGSAHAGDGSLPRTPVVHVGAACMTVVDRSVDDPVVHLDYSVPFSDTCTTASEPPQSRTHQFMALCRSAEPGETIPHWITAADVQASLDAGALKPEELPGESDVLDTAAGWNGCWLRITPDTERRPITCETALEGIDWDTRGAATGAFIVQGYTFHPPLNTWARRRGVVKIADAADDPPAVALEPHSPYFGDDAPLELIACVDAPPASVLTLAWSLDQTSTWNRQDDVEIAEDGDVELVLEPPEGLEAGSIVWIMVEITSQDDRTFRYVSPDVVAYVGNTTPPWNPPVVFDHCREDPNALDPQTCPGQTTTTTGNNDGGDGCSCTNAPASRAAGALLFVALGCSRRRTPNRRRHAVTGRRR
jgi:hypothetical protein